jgi:hypothetical protein
MKEIPLTNSPLKVLVDDADYEGLMLYKWWLNDKGYPITTLCRMDRRRHTSRKMHRFINPSWRKTDHENRNKLDNRRSNLRPCTHAQNNANVEHKRSGRFIGVAKTQGRQWKAHVSYKDRTLYLGNYNSELLAAFVRDAAARELHGPFAILNFPPTTATSGSKIAAT